MNTLAKAGLLYGRMMQIDEPHLIKRYNQALVGFGLPETKLTSFGIDMSGYSPDVAADLDDPQYLDPHGINRRFIILSPAQQSLPVVHTAFSNTGRLMHQFFDGNRRAIHALTIKDVIYGEIEEPVLEARDVEDLLAIEQVTFKVLTGDDLSSQATVRRQKIDRLTKEPRAWADDELLTDMVDLAKVCGDIRANTMVPRELVFRHEAFWTSHFGGVYVFHDEGQITVIGDPSTPGFRRSRPWQVSYIDKRDQKLIYQFLLDTGRVQTPHAAWLDRADWIEHRTSMLATMLAWHYEPEGDHDPHDRRWLKNWMNTCSSELADEGTVPFLLWTARHLEDWSRIDLDEIDARGRFILSRAKPGHRDSWLVNRLISDQVKFDYIARFMFNKEAFYADFETWPDGLQRHVVQRISNTYLKDKRALRSRLFGIDTT